jgi:hypothetical protein
MTEVEILENEETYIADEVEKAKTRLEILGANRGPSTKSRSRVKPSKVKTSRMKTFYMKKNRQSWKDFQSGKISVTEMMKLQKAGK